MKRCVVCAARILAEAGKGRRADEFLESMDVIEKHGDKLQELREIENEFSKPPVETFDMHTIQGRRMGRGLLYWYEVSSQTMHRSVDYETWRLWWEPLMVKTVKEAGNKKKE